MPTVEELYDRLIRPQEEERRRKEYARHERASLRDATPRAPSMHPGCKEHGHYPLGTWAIQKTPSGKTFAKCARCKQGYELSAISLSQLP